MATVNLDAARAARAEARSEGDRPSVVLGGREYALVHELPVEFPELLARAEFRLAIGMLLADPSDLEAFMGNHPTDGDLVEVARVYSFEGLGESPASGASSSSTSKRSRPTSKRTTGSTSARPAGVRPKTG